LIGTLIILVLYGLLPESYRFSRAIIFLGTLWFAAVLAATRLAGFLLQREGYVFGNKEKMRFLIIGSPAEAIRVETILKSTAIKTDFIGLISSETTTKTCDSCIGNMDQVPDIITIYNINEVIFCSKDVSHQTIIDKMTEWHASGINYKIAPEDSLSIIGSNSINTKGDLYTIAIQGIDNISNRRNKRFLDIIVAGGMLLAFPFIFVFIPKGMNTIRNALKVLAGRLTWVGYCQTEHGISKLPRLRQGVLNPEDGFTHPITDEELRNRINLLYARDYSVLKDINILSRSLKKTGRKL
jgi:hypothetical protein